MASSSRALKMTAKIYSLKVKGSHQNAVFVADKIGRSTEEALTQGSHFNRKEAI